MGEHERSNMEPIISPFVVLIDTAEQHPFTFANMKCDEDNDCRPLVVRKRSTCLGRHPHGLGDYSIEGMDRRVAVERKSVEDCQGTVLGWENRGCEGWGRRDRFEKELNNLAKLDAAMVVVEGSLKHVIDSAVEWGMKSRKTNAKILFRSIIAYQMDYVPWLFCDGRELAEAATYRFLERYWRHNK